MAWHGRATLAIFSVLAKSPGETGMTQWLGTPVGGRSLGPLLLRGSWPHSEFGHLKGNSNDHDGNSLSLGSLLGAKPSAQGDLFKFQMRPVGEALLLPRFYR